MYTALQIFLQQMLTNKHRVIVKFYMHKSSPVQGPTHHQLDFNWPAASEVKTAEINQFFISCLLFTGISDY